MHSCLPKNEGLYHNVHKRPFSHLCCVLLQVSSGPAPLSPRNAVAAQPTDITTWVLDAYGTSREHLIDKQSGGEMYES